MERTKSGELVDEIEKISEMEKCLSCQCFCDTLLLTSEDMGPRSCWGAGAESPAWGGGGQIIGRSPCRNCASRGSAVNDIPDGELIYS